MGLMSTNSTNTPTEGAEHTIPLSEEPTLVGIRGWLLLPAIGLAIGFLSAVLGLIRLLSLAFSGAVEVDIGFFIQLALLCFVCHVAQAFYRKDRQAPKLYIFLMWTMIALLVLSLAAGVVEEPSRPGEVVGNFLAAIIWTLYFLRSRRVKQTFVN